MNAKPPRTTTKTSNSAAKPKKISREDTATEGSAKKLSGLDAAAKILRASSEPMTASELVQRMLDGRLWSTAGKTPAATIYAAIVREIRTKGSASRFEKVDRGRFVARD